MASFARRARRGTYTPKQCTASKFSKYMPGVRAAEEFEDRLWYDLAKSKSREA